MDEQLYESKTGCMIYNTILNHLMYAHIKYVINNNTNNENNNTTTTTTTNNRNNNNNDSTTITTTTTTTTTTILLQPQGGWKLHLSLVVLVLWLCSLLPERC